MIEDALDQIMEVMEEAFDPAYGEAWNRRQVSDALILPNCHYLLAGEDGQAAAPGETAAGFILSRHTFEEEELLLVAVRPALRGRGIAGKLIARFMEKAKQRGARRVFLEMREGNPAESLYRNLGFREIGRRPNYYRRGRVGSIDALTFTNELKK
jgi:ribosomal-protein-alanine N-acetyltransferase